MKQMTYVCDRCKLPIKGDVYRVFAGIVDKETDELSEETFYLEETGESEVCGICLAQIDHEISWMMKKRTAATAKEQKKGFNITKALLMREEGKSLAEIGKELGCCQQTVLNQLNKYANSKKGDSE
jgi:hypothetical protein